MNNYADDGSQAPIIIPRPEHTVSRSDMSDSALKVLRRLHKAGYQAFLVGGGVRDLMLGLHPKDFDIATDATPDDIRDLFRNCRLIGRRFRLAHVHFARDVIEVATFRAAHDEFDGDDKKIDDSGRILRDNVYGTIDQDVWRRDFTANALYYNIADFSIWDYTGGVQDVYDRVLRLIGDPDTRYREDPVRMLRAVRFAAKLDFDIHEDTREPLYDMGDLLLDVPAARLFDETIKLFLAGHAQRTFELLREFGLFRYLFPSCADAIDDPDAEALRAMLDAAMINTDERVAQGKPVTVMFLLAVFMWGPIEVQARKLQKDKNMGWRQALFQASDAVLGEQQSYVTVPRRIMYPIRDMVVMQDRFVQRRAGQAAKLASHPRFRAAYDLLVLRAAGGLEDQELADWWTEYQADPANATPPASHRPPRKRRRRRRRNASGKTDP